jgi:hypothetical protein
MNWHIGQSVVALRNHSQGAFKKDDCFSIRGLQECKCKCSGIELNVGVRFPFHAGQRIKCAKCDMPLINDGIWWLSERNFVPLDTLCDISELTEILETTKPF